MAEDTLLSRMGGDPDGAHVERIRSLITRLRELHDIDHFAMGTSSHILDADIGPLTVQIPIYERDSRMQGYVQQSLAPTKRKSELLEKRHPDLAIDASVVPILRARGITADELDEALALIRRRPRVAACRLNARHATGDVWIRDVRLYREKGLVLAQCREGDLLIVGRTVAITRPVDLPATVITAMAGQRVTELVRNPLFEGSRSTVDKVWLNGKGKGQRLGLVMTARPITDRDAMMDLAA